MLTNQQKTSKPFNLVQNTPLSAEMDPEGPDSDAKETSETRRAVSISQPALSPTYGTKLNTVSVTNVDSGRYGQA